MSGVSSREQAHAWELRGAWAGGRAIVLRLEPRRGRLDRVAGWVTHVSPSGAFVVLEDPDAGEVHVPCGLILSVRRPHFHEPADERVLKAVRESRPRAVPVLPGQLSFLFEDARVSPGEA